jgi:peptidoglycan/LPS O-acetylase OafA/YrhL
MERLGMKRLECLDGLRGLLAVYVLLGHMAPFAALPAGLQQAVSHGGAAVDLFFVLSGLVITQSLQGAGGRAGPFLIGRVMRIFPVFLVVFAFAIAVEPASCGFEHMPWVGPDSAARTICSMERPHAWVAEILAHLTMTHGLFPHGILPDVWVSFLGSAWSLSTEWQFYVLALLLAGGGTRRLGWVLFGLAVAGVAWQAAVPEVWQFTRAFLPNKAHFFALGVASVGLVRGDRGAQDRGVLGRYCVVLVATIAVCAAQGSAGKLLPPLIWTLCLAIQMRPETAGLRELGWVLRSRAALYLGSISYCPYLVNEPIHKVVGAVLARFSDGNAMVFTLLWIPATIGLPLLVSAWLHVYLEVPALRWGRSAARSLAVGRVAAE